MISLPLVAGVDGDVDALGRHGYRGIGGGAGLAIPVAGFGFYMDVRKT